MKTKHDLTSMESDKACGRADVVFSDERIPAKTVGHHVSYVQILPHNVIIILKYGTNNKLIITQANRPIQIITPGNQATGKHNCTMYAWPEVVEY